MFIGDPRSFIEDRLESLSYTYMIPQFDEIIEQNDQTVARREHLEKLRELVGNAYPNQFVRSTLTGKPDTISALVAHPAVAAISAEMADVKSKLKER